MKVTAYKDPVTGLLFENEKQLSTFQANRKREEAAEKSRRAAQKTAEHSRTTLRRELASLEQLPALATKMYEFALNNAKTKRGKSPLHVVDVRIVRTVVNSSLSLHVDIEVELSGNPETTYSDPFVRLTPTDVLCPFSLRTCGSLKTSNKKFVYAYGLTAKLEMLPKLLATMRDAAQLLTVEATHQKNVDAKAKDLQANDLGLAEIDQDLEAARQALEAAQDAYGKVLAKRKRRADALAEKAARSMPFEHAERLEALKAASGLPMAGQTDRWLAAVVCNVLLDKVPVQA